MSRRDEWREVLDLEVQRWSAKSWEQLVCELRGVQAYEVELDSQKYQVEVEILEDTAEYVHLWWLLHDGSLPASISPLPRTFVSSKPQPTF